MPYKDESKLPGMDAPADVTTELSFSPPEGPFPRGNDNIVTGTISSNSDVDWIAIDLTAGVLYTFTLEGVDTDTTGDDTVSYAGSMMGVEVRLHSGKVDGGDAKGDVFVDTATNTYTIDTDPDPDEVEEAQRTETVPDFINITGSGMADILAGDSRANVIMGGGGNDELVGDPTGGTGSDDTLHGGEGDDLLGRTTVTPARPRDLNGDGDVEDTVDGTDEATAIPLVAAITDDPGDDTMHGGPGDDKLYGGAGSDTLNGGPGDDDLTGGGDADVFVFTPDGLASDVILDFSNTAGVATTDGTATSDGTGDKIDLSAFNIDSDDLPSLLSERAGSVILNLEDYGGGRVTIQGGVTLAGLMQGTGADDPHLIHVDVNGDTAGVGGTVDGVTGQDGVFIL